MLLARAIGRHSAGLPYFKKAMELKVSPPPTTCSLEKSAVSSLSAWASNSAFENSLKVTCRRARTGVPFGKNRMNFWLARAIRQVNDNEDHVNTTSRQP